MYRSEKSFMRDPATVNCRIYIGGLDKNITSEILEEHFKKHGNIVGVVVQPNFGFIQFEEESSAQDAIKNEHGVTLQGRKLNVRPAFDNKNKQPNEEVAGNSGKGPSDMPPRKMPRRGGITGRGRGGHGGMDRDVSPHNDDREYSQYRDVAPYYGGDSQYPVGGGYNKMPDRPVVPERNDCEIIVVSKALTEYAEYIEQRLKSVGLTVDLLFPNEDVPIGRVLANISSRGCLYAVLVMPQNEEHRSLTLNILYGLPQEHRNMPVDDAIALISRNFDAYMRGEKTGLLPMNSAPVSLLDRHPEPIQILLNLLADNRQLTTLQYDRIIKYLQERRELQYKQEVGDSMGLDKDENTKAAELQNRILNILNQKSPGAPSPVSAPTFPVLNVNPMPVPKPTAPILLNDPSVQKALDSLMQGDLLKNITSGSRF